MILLLLAGCSTGPDLVYAPCTESHTPIALDDAGWTGFSGADVLDVIGQTVVLDIVWDETFGPTGETLTVTLSPAGTAEVVDHGESIREAVCADGVSLAIPLEVDVTSASGGFEAEDLPGEATAWSLAPADIRFGNSASDGFAPSGDFADEAADAVEAFRPGTQVEKWAFEIGGAMTSGSAHLTFWWNDSDSQGDASLLTGHWGDAPVE